MVEFLIEPFGEAFMVRAMAEAVLIGLPAGLLGCWIVLYRLSYTAESVAHSIFPGLVIAALAGIPLILGGTPALLLGAAAIALLSGRLRVERDIATAVVITALFGLGSLLALSAEAPPRLESILFGDILGTSDGDLVAAGFLAVAVMIGLWLMHPRLTAVGFDPASARSLGAAPAITELILILLLATTVLIAVQSFGNLLVVAVLIGPAATARLLSNRLASMLLIAAGLTVVLSLVGLYLSYYLGTAAGASIALAIVITYLITAAVQTFPRPPIGNRLFAPRYDPSDAQ